MVFFPRCCLNTSDTTAASPISSNCRDQIAIHLNLIAKSLEFVVAGSSLITDWKSMQLAAVKDRSARATSRNCRFKIPARDCLYFLDSFLDWTHHCWKRSMSAPIARKCTGVLTGLRGQAKALLPLLGLIVYTLLGAILFSELEGPNEQYELEQLQKQRKELFENTVYRLNNVRAMQPMAALNHTRKSLMKFQEKLGIEPVNAAIGFDEGGQGMQANIDREYMNALAEAADEGAISDADFKRMHSGNSSVEAADISEHKEVDPRSMDAVISRMPLKERLLYRVMPASAKKRLNEVSEQKLGRKNKASQTDMFLLEALLHEEILKMELNNELPTRQVSVSPSRVVGTGVRVTHVHPVSVEDSTPQPTGRSSLSDRINDSYAKCTISQRWINDQRAAATGFKDKFTPVRIRRRSIAFTFVLLPNQASLL
ncbi:hypothetical protein TELCIR_05801 [Teladorsagia circumcincta]|uniref:Uncharacterized protein n=1 Tax=Teladorsagia circumcincta TaxID=45464 RepID=A0A2G9UPV6_TELCI|nr:hypothetical protein TELCIR_05801 [Teladorsagia circumcincta]